MTKHHIFGGYDIWLMQKYIWWRQEYIWLKAMQTYICFMENIYLFQGKDICVLWQTYIWFMAEIKTIVSFPLPAAARLRLAWKFIGINFYTFLLHNCQNSFLLHDCQTKIITKCWIRTCKQLLLWVPRILLGRGHFACQSTLISIQYSTAPTWKEDLNLSKRGPKGDLILSEKGTKRGPSATEKGTKWGPKKHIFDKLTETC